MSLQEWQCPHCGEPIDDFCVRLEEKEDGAVIGYCWDCAELIATAYGKANRARGQGVETVDQESLERRVQRVEAVWKLWITEAENGRISQATFHAMKHLLGMDKP
jgi:hypothetical protein